MKSSKVIVALATVGWSMRPLVAPSSRQIAAAGSLVSSSSYRARPRRARRSGPARRQGLPEGAQRGRQPPHILGLLQHPLAAAQFAVEPRHGAGERRVVVVEPRVHGVGEDDDRALQLEPAERPLGRDRRPPRA